MTSGHSCVLRVRPALPLDCGGRRGTPAWALAWGSWRELPASPPPRGATRDIDTRSSWASLRAWAGQRGPRSPDPTLPRECVCDGVGGAARPGLLDSRSGETRRGERCQARPLLHQHEGQGTPWLRAWTLGKVWSLPLKAAGAPARSCAPCTHQAALQASSPGQGVFRRGRGSHPWPQPHPAAEAAVCRTPGLGARRLRGSTGPRCLVREQRTCVSCLCLCGCRGSSAPRASSRGLATWA